ncbi:MAG: ribonuclease Z [Candidatus Thermoplasmatota archaeon]
MSSGASVKLVFLGTGGSYPIPERNVSSLALKVDGEVLLFDCGEGTQRQLMSSSVSFMQVDKIFLSHLHGDHILGLPGLLQSMNMNDREKGIEIFGPKDTARVLKDILFKGYFRPGFPVSITELNPSARLDFDDFSVKTFRADHNVPTLAYSFEQKDKKGRFDREKALDLGVPEGPLFSKIHRGETVEVGDEIIRPEQVVGPPRRGRKVFYSGDTKPCAETIEGAFRADALIHDGTLDASMGDIALNHDHSSVEMAAEVARKAEVERLFITHISPRYRSTGKLKKQAKDIFENSEVPPDLSEYEI